MRLIYSTILFLMIACHNGQNTTDFISQEQFEFKLIDGLGAISISYPERTDTFFSWVQRSDCGKPCEHGDYRFQYKQNPIFKESGFYWTGEPEDSVDQLSIYHQRPDTVLKHRDSTIIRMRNQVREKVLNDPGTVNVLSDTLIKINDRYFCIFQTADFNKKTNVRDRRLIAFTTISGTLLEFHYKLLTKQYDSILTTFFDKSMKNLKTVKIKDGG